MAENTTPATPAATSTAPANATTTADAGATTEVIGFLGNLLEDSYRRTDVQRTSCTTPSGQHGEFSEAREADPAADFAGALLLCLEPA